MGTFWYWIQVRGLFWYNVGLFWYNVGLFWYSGGLFWCRVGLTYYSIWGSFDIGCSVRLFWYSLGLFWYNVGLFWYGVGLFWYSVWGSFDIGWRRPIGCLKLQVTIRERATNYRALFRKMTYKDKASYDFTPPCIGCRCFCRERGVWECVKTPSNTICVSCRMCKWVMAHIWMSHVTRTNASWHTCEWVMAHKRLNRIRCVCHPYLCMRHDTHIVISSCIEYESVTHMEYESV